MLSCTSFDNLHLYTAWNFLHFPDGLLHVTAQIGAIDWQRSPVVSAHQRIFVG